MIIEFVRIFKKYWNVNKENNQKQTYEKILFKYLSESSYYNHKYTNCYLTSVRAQGHDILSKFDRINLADVNCYLLKFSKSGKA